MNRGRWPAITCLILVCLLLGAGNVFPEHNRVSVSDGNIYLTVESGAVWYTPPKLNSFSNSVNLASYVFIRQSKYNEFEVDDAGFTGNIVLGFTLDKHPQTFLNLRNVRIELNAIHGISNETFNSSEIVNASEFFDILPINGNPSQGAMATAGQQVTTSATGTFRINEAGITLKADLPHVNGRKIGNILPTLSIGALISKIETNYSVSQQSIPAGAFNNLDEGLRATCLGPYIGGTLLIQPLKDINLSIKADIAALYSWAKLIANQKTSVANIMHYYQDDKKYYWSTRISSGAAIDYDAGPVIIGIEGTISYWNAMPGIVNPRSGPGIDADVAKFDAAHIEKGKMADKKLMFKVYVPLDNIL